MERPTNRATEIEQRAMRKALFERTGASTIDVLSTFTVTSRRDIRMHLRLTYYTKEIVIGTYIVANKQFAAHPPYVETYERLRPKFFGSAETKEDKELISHIDALPYEDRVKILAMLRAEED